MGPPESDEVMRVEPHARISALTRGVRDMSSFTAIGKSPVERESLAILKRDRRWGQILQKKNDRRSKVQIEVWCSEKKVPLF